MALGRYLADTMSVVPRFSRPEFERLYNESVQDAVMVSYLANLMRAQVCLLATRFGAVYLPLCNAADCYGLPESKRRRGVLVIYLSSCCQEQLSLLCVLCRLPWQRSWGQASSLSCNRQESAALAAIFLDMKGVSTGWRPGATSIAVFGCFREWLDG